MTSRRTFIKELAAVPAVLALPAWAAPSATRHALVIGNGAYHDAPLVNTLNDAKAVGTLLAGAGFSVDTQVNAKRADMIAAIERLGAAAKRSESSLIVFYYAGHGVQLDWRNYLLPIDAEVENHRQLKERCVDLAVLLDKLGAAKGKTFMIILDACRNDPFGLKYRPEQKGLSQFDAPVGSLLAYATSPGSVASDGAGQNGLYTEHLVREMSRPGTRIEDALKRVRLNVRLDSQGAQIPWETTSLESDVFIYEADSRKLGEAELEQLIESDIAEWTRIKSSKRLDDLVGYLRRFPNGRFAEIAQMKLARMLAEVERERYEREQKAAVEHRRNEELARLEAEKRKDSPQTAQASASTSTPVAAPSPKPIAPKPALVLGDDRPAPMLLKPSNNPYSAGRYPLGRKFSVGDQAVIRKSDILTGVEERTNTIRVTRVDAEEDRVEFNDGAYVSDLMGNWIKLPEIEYDVPLQFSPAEIFIGNKWTAAFRHTKKGKTSNAYYNVQVVRRENVKVPAGNFDSFLIEGTGWNTTFGSSMKSSVWIVPGVNFLLKSELVIRGNRGQFIATERRELVSLQQAEYGGSV